MVLWGISLNLISVTEGEHMLPTTSCHDLLHPHAWIVDHVGDGVVQKLLLGGIGDEAAHAGVFLMTRYSASGATRRNVLNSEVHCVDILGSRARIINVRKQHFFAT